MKIRDVMTRDVHLARPADTIQDVASRMAKGDFGFVPVADGDQPRRACRTCHSFGRRPRQIISCRRCRRMHAQTKRA